MDELDIPLLVPEAAARARQMGIRLSDWQAYKLVRDGRLAASHVGQTRTTVRSIIDALSPSSPGRAAIAAACNADAGISRGGR